MPDRSTQIRRRTCQPKTDVPLDVAGLMLRVRRSADLSQRELAEALGVGQSTVARIENGVTDVRVGDLEQLLALAGLRLAVVDAEGYHVVPVPADELRDRGGRRPPAHLDARPPFDPPALRLAEPKYDRPEPLVWFHHRVHRDQRRAELGLRPDHDHPTVRDVAEHRARTTAARLEHARRSARLDPFRLDDCVCHDECWYEGACAAACVCTCGE